ncbi:MAG: ABC transporter ATP-binding protein [Anaerolineales bacterium]|nr:ABC transporter ATP-binding protein [Anaerolineales bacterium]
MIEVTDLSKSYGAVQALRGVSFKIAEGEIVGLLGPNGAGKTTILKILIGYLQPDSGTVIMDGLDVLTHTREVQARIGYLPENAPLYPDLNVQTYLKMMAEIRQIPPDEQLACFSEAVRAVGVEEYLTRPIGKLSKGYRQRVGLAQAILHRPRILILDEPTLGLDPTQIIEIRKLIKRLSTHSTVLFSSHILPEVEVLCDRAIILMNGEIKADAHLSDLASTKNTILVLNKDVTGVKKALQSLGSVSQVETFQTPDGYPAYRIMGKKGAELNPEVFHLAAKENWPLRELRRDVRTLEMVFNELAVAA